MRKPGDRTGPIVSEPVLIWFSWNTSNSAKADAKVRSSNVLSTDFECSLCRTCPKQGSPNQLRVNSNDVIGFKFKNRATRRQEKNLRSQSGFLALLACIPMLTFEAIQAFLEYFPSHISDLHSGETVVPQIGSVRSTFRQPQRPLWIASIFLWTF